MAIVQWTLPIANSPYYTNSSSRTSRIEHTASSVVLELEWQEGN